MGSAMRSLTPSAPGSRTARSCGCWKAARRSKYCLKTGGVRSKNRETGRCGSSAALRAQASWRRDVQIVRGCATKRSARSFAATRRNAGSDENVGQTEQFALASTIDLSKRSEQTKQFALHFPRRQMMKRLLSIALFAAMLISLGVIANAQDDNKSPEENKNPGNITIPEGKLAKLSLQTRLSSKLNEVNDEVTAVLYEPVRGEDGRVVIA